MEHMPEIIFFLLLLAMMFMISATGKRWFVRSFGRNPPSWPWICLAYIYCLMIYGIWSQYFSLSE